MKLFTGKMFTAVIALLSVACIAGVGYSAWVITGSHAPELSGNVTVDGVIDNITSVTVGESEGNQSLSYGAPSEAADGTGWLYSDGASSENLSLVYHFTFSNYAEGSSFALGISVSDGKSDAVYSSPFSSYSETLEGLSLYDGGQASYESAVSRGFISDASAAHISVKVGEGSDLSYADGIFSFSGTSQSSCTAEVTITFSWGELFGGENPYYKYKDLTSAKDRIEAADTLAYIAACLEDVRYTIKFTPQSGN